MGKSREEEESKARPRDTIETDQFEHELKLGLRINKKIYFVAFFPCPVLLRQMLS